MEDMFWAWLGIAVICAVVEAVTPALVSIWFMLGGVSAMLLSALGFGLSAQLSVFISVSIILIILTRPLAKRMAVKKTSTNADRIIGEKAIVTEEICNMENKGQIVVLGQTWSALSDNGDIPVGSVVRILEIKGVKAIVEREV